MSKKLLISTLAALATTGAFLSTPAFAADTITNIKQAYEAVEKAGYKDNDIQSIKHTTRGYRATVFNEDNRKTRLMINPTDGSITVHEKRRDCDQDERRGGRKGEGKGRNN